MSADYEIKDGRLVEYYGYEADIVIPDGVTEIGDKVFQNNKKIVSVVMPDTVVKIGENAFGKCTKLKSVTFSKNLEEIEYEGFVGCSALKTIELPETLRSLGHGAFAGCTKLDSVKCESEVFEAGSDPFRDFGSSACTQLADKNGFLIFCGVLYTYYGTATEIIIPDGVKTIVGGALASGAFSWEKKLDIRSVEIPESVKVIGNNAFANNKKLKTVKMPSGVKLGENVFAGCSGLADENGLFIHDGVACAYYGDGDTVLVTAGTRVLSKKLFANGYGCNPGNKNIHTVILPDGLEEIGDSAFADCDLIERITIPDSVQTIGSGAFAGCDHLVQVDMPEKDLRMGEGVFAGCRGLADENGFILQNNELQSFFGSEREIVVPEGVVSIASGVFNKTGITSIKLPSTLKQLGSAFWECCFLTEIDIPEGVEELKNHTFSGCSGLKRVTLPDSLVVIEDSVFEGCEQLEDITIPEGVKRIGKCAFQHCAALEKIIIPNGVRLIAWKAFSDCRSLRKVYLPESVREIDGNAFEDCTTLEEVTIPDAVEVIGYSAFENCASLKTLHYAKMRAEISRSAFTGCSGLVDENGLTIIADTLWSSKGDTENVVVPEGITRIAPDAFREEDYIIRGKLKSITLPSTLKEIGSGAFAGCKALGAITVPNSVESIGEEGFKNCVSLTGIDLPDSITHIGKRAFKGCTALKTARLPTSVTELPSELFMDCKALKTILIPGAVDSLGDDAFRGCSSLSAIAVEEGNAAYSSENGMLYNRSGDTLLVVPGGQNLKEYTIPERVKTIGRHAFIDCLALQKVVIPATVENVGDEAFPRNEWNSKSKLKDIEVSPKAGSGTVGENIFDIMERDKPLVYPKLPVTFVKEQTTQVCLGLGYCQNPEKYEGEYAEIYRKYAHSHQKTLIKKAQQQKLKAVEQYFFPEPENQGLTTVNGYKPNLSLKKPNELQKVEILEETVIKGTLDDLKDVIKTYKSFELTARALGLAARYRGVDFVRTLVDNGATFQYKSEASLQRKYAMDQKTAAGSYRTEYYLMLVPSKLDLKMHSYTPMCGVSHMNISDEMEKRVLPLDARIEVVKYLAGITTLGVSLDEMLFWALTRGELDFADALMEMGVDLQKTPPSYYYGGEVSTYMAYIDTITTAGRSLYWTSYVFEMAQLKAGQVLPVLERLHSLAAAAGKKLALSQDLFDKMNWSDASLSFALRNMDFSKVNQKKALEAAVSQSSIASLSIMAENGWLAQPAKREKLIVFARDNKHLDALAWLMDFKNRTVDVAAEEAKKEKQAQRELMEDPNSVSALKKIWSYKKLEDGTLKITSYKGSDTEVVIPSVIGKAKVSVIGEDAFSASSWGRKTVNYDIRKKITTVTIPEGITEIEKSAFYECESLEKVQLPGTLKTIGAVAFRSCENLREVSGLAGVKIIDVKAFWNCGALKDENGYAVVDGILLGYYGRDTSLRIPDGVRSIVTLSCGSSYMNYDPEKNIKEIILPEGLQQIGESAFEGFKALSSVTVPASVKMIGTKAFYGSGLKTVVLQEGLETIGAGAFAWTPLETVHIPRSVKAIGAQAFYGCSRMRDIFIPAETKKLYRSVLGSYDSDESYSASKPSGIYVHTPAGSAAEEYMKQYSGVHVVHE